MEMYMPTEIIKHEDDIIRGEEFIAIMDDNDSFRSLSEIVNEITDTLSLTLNQ